MINQRRMARISKTRKMTLKAIMSARMTGKKMSYRNVRSMKAVRIQRVGLNLNTRIVQKRPSSMLAHTTTSAS